MKEEIQHRVDSTKELFLKLCDVQNRFMQCSCVYFPQSPPLPPMFSAHTLILIQFWDYLLSVSMKELHKLRVKKGAAEISSSPAHSETIRLTDVKPKL